MNIRIPDEKFVGISGNGLKLLGYYQHCEQPITEGVLVTGRACGLGGEAVARARAELELLGLISITRPSQTSISILLMNY